MFDCSITRVISTALKILSAAMMLFVLQACEREDGIVSSDSAVAVNIPDKFAAYINNNSGLPSGDYTVVVATNGAGESGSFSLTIAYDDGTEEVYEGSWVSSGGQDQTATSNPSFDISLSEAGGLSISVDSMIDSYLYLLRRQPSVDGSVDRTGPVFAENDNADSTTLNAQINIASSNIDSESFGKAYYDTIDPTDAKTTLEDWKVANGYYEAVAAGRVVEPRFRDTKDLGYGRGMRAWVDAQGNFFSFVENFQVRTSAGNEYTDLNLDALINDTREHHFGSNAIEYSTYPYGVDPISGDPEPCNENSTYDSTPVLGYDCRLPTGAEVKKFNKFFTFDATQGSQTEEDHPNEIRLNRVNLDGRGNKAMPGACVYCHGGTVRPLRADGSYRDNCYDGDIDGDGSPCNGLNGDTNAKLQLLEVDSFAFWQESGEFEQANQEPLIKAVNLMIYCTYPGADAAACGQAFCPDAANPATCDGSGVPVEPASTGTSGNNGRWSGDFAREMAEGWYDGDGNPATADWGRATFDGEFVPAGWDPAPGGIPVSGREGVDQLFLDVVQPICFVCHSRRGSLLGTNQNAGVSKDIDFSTYEKFISHADQIKSYVYDRGVMPLSLRGYNAFWDDPGRPTLLALYINAALESDPDYDGDLITFNADGTVDQPGAVVADAGPDRVSPSPVRLFASNTRFADTYSWEILSTPLGGEDAALDNDMSARPVFTATQNGDYQLRLTATNAEGGSDTDTVNVKIDNTMTPAPAAITFLDDIVPILETIGGNSDGKACVTCHQADGAGGEIDGVPVYWTAAPSDSGVSRYAEALARVDFDDPENSLLLMKPSGNHHYGNLREGFDIGNPADRQNYDMMLNWIMEGARYSSASMRE